MQESSVSGQPVAAEAEINRMADEFLTVFATDPGEAQAQFAASVLGMLGALVQAHERLLELQSATLVEAQMVRQLLEHLARPAARVEPD